MSYSGRPAARKIAPLVTSRGFTLETKDKREGHRERARARERARERDLARGLILSLSKNLVRGHTLSHARKRESETLARGLTLSRRNNLPTNARKMGYERESVTERERVRAREQERKTSHRRVPRACVRACVRARVCQGGSARALSSKNKGKPCSCAYAPIYLYVRRHRFLAQETEIGYSLKDSKA